MLRRFIAMGAALLCMVALVACRSAVDDENADTTADAVAATTEMSTIATTTASAGKTTTLSSTTTTVTTTTATVFVSEEDPLMFFAPAANGIFPSAPASADMKTITLKFNSYRAAFEVKVPFTWEAQLVNYTSSLNYAVLYCDGKPVARIIPWRFVDKLCTGTVLKTEESGLLSLETVKYSSADTGQCAYAYRAYVTLATCPTVCLEADAAVMGFEDFATMAHSLSRVIALRDDNRLGVSNFSDLSVGICGNSFVATSAVGDALQSMFDANGRSASVSAQSYGGCSVDEYTEMSAFTNALVCGLYDVVFLCGFYSSNDSSRVRELEILCEQSGTILVLFPAPNEDRSYAEDGYYYCESARLADWQGLVYHLQDKGIPDRYLTTYDAHNHSRASSGYAAAVMLYYMLFETMPAEGTGTDNANSDLQYNFSLSRQESLLVLEDIRQLTETFVAYDP